MKASEQELVRSRIADLCIEIEDMFKSKSFVTVIVRMPSLADGGVLVTSDTPEEAAKELKRLSGKPPIVAAERQDSA